MQIGRDGRERLGEDGNDNHLRIPSKFPTSDDLKEIFNGVLGFAVNAHPDYERFTEPHGSDTLFDMLRRSVNALMEQS